VIQIRVPPLRERIEDVGPICAALLERIARDAGVWPPPVLSADGLAALEGLPFAGNVRELENLLHRAVALSGGDVIARADLGLAEDLIHETSHAELDARLAQVRAAPIVADEPELPSDLVAYLDAVERDVLTRALARCRNNRTAAGASLGLSLRQMRYRMARLGVIVAGNDGE
jgi:two-component system response regulator PilR (NtrC family)